MLIKTRTASAPTSAANLSFEAKRWITADKFWNIMGGAEYKHVNLGLIVLKHSSEAFQEQRTKLVVGMGNYTGANSDDQDEYKAENVFWMPHLKKQSQATHHRQSLGRREPHLLFHSSFEIRNNAFAIRLGLQLGQRKTHSFGSLPELSKTFSHNFFPTRTRLVNA